MSCKGIEGIARTWRGQKREASRLGRWTGPARDMDALQNMILYGEMSRVLGALRIRDALGLHTTTTTPRSAVLLHWRYIVWTAFIGVAVVLMGSGLHRFRRLLAHNSVNSIQSSKSSQALRIRASQTIGSQGVGVDESARRVYTQVCGHDPPSTHHCHCHSHYQSSV